ncbi:uncharacterized protein BO97DRAFT_422803 [Aspergillus homomorphus CBS 101889]|uniref:Uncharacterized protein n=1 Tax=Aspergillus homomorphus (strain CBS 101889) TaxID=1450537 RepID=A0A395I3T2_ASPHC|nr:hypothetical protein BO97DRAFT_422803 [Aspergillus homomorphus CBS 101889]RAL14386.1 hypothetical protein BO97DRAFT_422803 [Aspergillus homomorphus CBS 101889]
MPERPSQFCDRKVRFLAPPQEKQSPTSPASNCDPESHFWACTRRLGQVEDRELAEVFDKLKPVDPTLLSSSRWKGFIFHTGHPTEKNVLEKMRFAGKDFISANEVYLMAYDEYGGWTRLESWKATLREVKFRGVVSAALIYDHKPIIDHWRYVTDDVVMVALEDDESLTWGAGVLYGYMKRVVF